MCKLSTYVTNRVPKSSMLRPEAFNTNLLKKKTSDKVFPETNSESRMRKRNSYCKEYTDAHTRGNKLEKLKLCVKSHCNYRDIV